MSDKIRKRVEDLLQTKRDQATIIPRLGRVARLLGLSQADIARSIGASQPAVSRWMDGSRIPTPRYIPALRDLLEALEAEAMR